MRCIHGRDLRIITLTNASSLVDTLTNLTKLAAISGSLLMDISDGSDANLSDVNDRPSPRELLQAAVEGAATGAC